MTFRDWDRRLLAALDAAPTGEHLRFLHAWQACEGGTARFNPLNTTLVLPGSTAYNRAGVRHYRDELQGLAATILTLRLKPYDELRAALAAPDSTAPQILARSSAALHTWGTGTACITEQLRRR